MENFFDSLKNFASPRYIFLGIVGVALLVIFSFLSFRLAEPVMSTLYNNLTTEDSAAVVTELGGMGVKFEVASGGSEIKVESKDVLRVRMTLAEKGLPNRANIVGYEIFDKESLIGTSNFVMNVNLVRALEGELSRTISSLSSIKGARVHLVIPRKDVFKRQDFEPSASVVLTLNNRLDVAKNEAVAVRHLVSSSVPGLKASKVTIIDNNGKVLAKARNEEDDEFGSSGDAAEFKTQVEEKMRRTITELLTQAVGEGKVEAQVTVDASFEKISRVSEEYNPDQQVARSSQTTEEINSSANKEGGQVSVANELTGENPAGNGSSENNQKTDEITNYEISKTITNKVDDAAKIKRVSVAVLVDGKYNKDGAGNEVYIPRTDEELDQIKTLVKSAIGFDESRDDKIEVINMQFSKDTGINLPQEDPLAWLKQDLDSIIKTLVLGVVAILVVLLVIKPLVGKAFEISANDLEEEELKNQASLDALQKQLERAEQTGGSLAGIPGLGGGEKGGPVNMDVIQSKIEYSPAQKVNDIIENNPEETLAVIRSWLSEK